MLPPGVDAWVTWAFDHPVADPAWHWSLDAERWQASHEEALQLTAQLFEQPADILRRFSDAQLNQGFWFLIGSNGDVMRGLDNESIPWELRWRCIRSFTTLFQDLFAQRCSAHLSHLLRADTPSDASLSPLNGACYMWWDFDCWVARPNDGSHRKLDGAFLEVMRQTLAMPHDACRESALHGLGHWHHGYPAETQRIIDEFLAPAPSLRPELRAYALQARCGCVALASSALLYFNQR